MTCHTNLLQQYLPFTVLKLYNNWLSNGCKKFTSCNSTYRLRYWNSITSEIKSTFAGCNSTYRLRYWNSNHPIFLLLLLDCVATVLTVYGIETDLFWMLIQVNEGCNSTYRLRYWNLFLSSHQLDIDIVSCNSTYRLRYWNIKDIAHTINSANIKLQQYLPLTVLKHIRVELLCLAWC